MPLSGVQQGTIGETEVAKIGMLTTEGELEFAQPTTDDDARDREVHQRGHFGPSLWLQIKTSMHLYHDRGKKAPLLTIEFRSRHPLLVSHPLYWFLFAFLDAQLLGFRDPLFLIPSEFLFAHIKSGAVKEDNEKQILYMIRANMSPESHDMWSPYKVMCRDLGPRLLQILHEAEHSATAARRPYDFTLEPGGLWVARGGRASSPRTPAKYN